MFCNKVKYTKACDEHNSVRMLLKFPVGDRVMIKTDQEKLWDTTGTIRSGEADVANQSYIIETKMEFY